MTHPLKSISILIPAFNEERNIGQLLEDIIAQGFSEVFRAHFKISLICVVNDCSTDHTREVVETVARKDGRVVLLSNEERIGKTFSLKKGIAAITTDYIILLDADVRLQPDTLEHLVAPLLQTSYDLIGGNPVPTNLKSWGIAKNAALFSWFLLQEIKKRNPNGIHSSHGRILMLSRNLYQKLEIGRYSTPGDDQYIYLKSNHNFFYAKDAVVLFKSPTTIKDYLKQNVRFRIAKLTRLKSVFDKDLISKEFKLKNVQGIFSRAFIFHPYAGFCWAVLYTIGYLKFELFAKNMHDIHEIWGEITTSK